MDRHSARNNRLNKVFDSILHGKVGIAPHLGPLFLEAMYTHRDPVACTGELVASSSGLSAFQAAIRYDLSPKFFNTHVTAILEFLQTSALKTIDNGQFLNNLIVKIVDPPMFWTAFMRGFLNGELKENATASFGWLLLQLCSLPIHQATTYRQDPDLPVILTSLVSSGVPKIVNLGKKITEILTLETPAIMADPSNGAGPGGRHDNDFMDFRKISILPTSGELSSTDTPFLRPSSVLEDPRTESNRVAIHLDNQFRLLREDMLYEMREELDVALGRKKGHHKGVSIAGFSVKELDFGTEDRRTKWGLVCVCRKDLPQLKKMSEEKERKKYLMGKRNFFKHQSLACLVAGKEILAFPTIHRDETRLSKNPPEIVLRFENGEETRLALRNLKRGNDVKLIQINTGIFAYEPVLKGLQQVDTLPLSSELLLWKEGNILEEIPTQATVVINALRKDPSTNLKRLLSISKSIYLDASQARSLLSGLTQKVSLIQGPPGTGKSFIGALIAKSIHDFTKQTMLVVCYTNHALDDILESLLDIGIPKASMLRLGSQSTSRTEPLKLQHRKRAFSLNQSAIDELKGRLKTLRRKVQSAFEPYLRPQDLADILHYLKDEEPKYFKAFYVPDSEDRWQVVGADSNVIGPDYLFDKWVKCDRPGAFAQDIIESNLDVWNMLPEDRKCLVQQWNDTLIEISIEELSQNTDEFNRCQQSLVREFNSNTAKVLRSKRIVGCTTTAAAMLREDIQKFNPDVLLVEEAGEILESHVLTSIGPHTSQMILIGDHKQLRPKVNNYLLTIEKGEGFDLNRSLFERLILKNYPHESLSEQHRMRPEISALIRHLSYPELRDAPETENRPNLRGVQDNIVFIHHEHPEDVNGRLADRCDVGSTTSKQNSFEIQMVLKIVKYLAQQGYGTDELVILTPYLGQLSKLRDILKKDNDPILNDLDFHELLRAGLIDPAEAKINKKPIRLATVDNYQGEESDIVIVSLTRSNPKCDIGFMFSPERLNVLLSRARNALIMVGNAKTFKKAKKGGELWRDLFDLLGHGKNIYQGFPVKCERHPDTKASLQVEDFDKFCPDGGCDLPCKALLSCGHSCPSKCHELSDHSKRDCKEMMFSECLSGHLQTWPCHSPPRECKNCEQAKRSAEKKRQDEIDAQERRAAEEQQHLKLMDKINAEIEEEKRLQEEERLEKKRTDAILQKQLDLYFTRAARILISTGSSNPASYTCGADP